MGDSGKSAEGQSSFFFRVPSALRKLVISQGSPPALAKETPPAAPLRMKPLVPRGIPTLPRVPRTQAPMGPELLRPSRMSTP